jgi:hypothetical protein
VSGEFLFAAGGDWIVPLLVALGSFAVWVYNQIKEGQKEKPPPAEKPESELEDLLRRGLHGEPRPQQPPAQGGRPPQSARPPVRRPEKPAAPPGRLAQPLSQQAAPDERPVAVSQHVQKHLDTHEFDERTEALGQLGQIDDTVDDHVHDAFDHEVASIGAEGGAAEEGGEGATGEPGVAAAAAAGIGAVFADPDQLRTAIILQEILRPPSWE